MKPFRLLAVTVALSSGFSVHAADVPRSSPDDARVRVAKYSPSDVTVIRVRRGTATRITLAPDEAITTAVYGFSSRCDDEVDEWCIDATKGANQIFVRPKEGATHNNLELRTNQRDYSLEFVVVADEQPSKTKRSAPEQEPFFRVQFEYPKPQVSPRVEVAAQILSAVEQGSRQPRVPSVAMTPAERLKLEPVAVRNSNFTMQVLENGEDAAPSLVFDDGRFTYFEFLGAREVPAIEAHGSDGEPIRTNWHMEPPYIVVERLARKFTLRLGSAVVGVFNESFDPIGAATGTSTGSRAVRRELKEPQQ